MFGNLPLTSLRVLEAVARTGSPLGASYELSVTPGAISRQIRELEALAGTKMFERVGGEWHLTPAGQSMAGSVSVALSSMRYALEAAQTVDMVPLRIAVSRAFATYVIAPHMKQFIDAFPQVSLYVQCDRLGERPSADLDLVVRYAIPDDVTTFPQVELPGGAIYPAAAPSLLGDERPTHPDDWPHCPMLAFLPLDHWAEWILATGKRPRRSRMVHFSDSMVLFEAAAGGAGIALGHSLLCHRHLVDQRLIPIGEPVQTNVHYFATLNPNKKPETRAFVDWLEAIMITLETEVSQKLAETCRA